MFDAKFENGLISNALKSGLSFSPSTAGEAVASLHGVGDKPVQFPIPCLMSEEEVKLSFAHAPVKEGARICWGHSSWRSRPRGASCSFAHSMITTKNLHWLIRSQLAKRGGHRSQMRIAPDAVPGYIAALRETNLDGDGKERTKPVQIWKPKGGGPVLGHAEVEVSFRSADLNHAVGDVPVDFQDIGYTALEGKLDQLVHSTDCGPQWTSLAN